MFGYAQIPLDGPDQTLSETQVYDLVSDKVRSGPLGSPTSPQTLSAGFSEKVYDKVWLGRCSGI